MVGQFDIQINSTVKSVFFLLFLYALGYNVGPGFFKALKKDGIPQVLFSIIVCVTGLVCVVIAGKILGYNAGQAAGLTAGALTQSSVIGVGQDSIVCLNASADEIKTMSDFVPIGYAVTYFFGTIGSVVFLSIIAPKILGINLQEECKKVEEGSSNSMEGANSAQYAVSYRSFIIGEPYVGKTVREVEETFSTGIARIFIKRIRTGNQIIDAAAERYLQEGDHVAIAFKDNSINHLELECFGKEISDIELLDFPIETQEILVKSDTVNHKSIGKITEEILSPGVFILCVKRNGTVLLCDDDLEVLNKDILTLEGPKEAVNKLTKVIGKPLKREAETDVVILGLGILLGGFIGIPAITIAGIDLSLSTSGGALIMGLIFGYIHDRRPLTGYIPKSTIWFLNNVGLAAFIAVVGINAGPGFVSGLKASGVSFFLAGVVVTLVPLLAGVLVGKHIFKWNGALILGACAGAMTTTASLGAVCEKAKSNVQC